MQSVTTFRDSLLDYLYKQREYEQADIETITHLTPEEKVERGVMIRDAKVRQAYLGCYELQTEEDNTKIRVGDKVSISVKGKPQAIAKIIDLGLNSICIETETLLNNNDLITIEVIQHMMLDSIISLMERIDEGRPGAYFLKQLAGMEPIIPKGIGAIPPDRVFTIPQTFNESQKKAVNMALKRPSIGCIQGPPGTGKTAVLAAIANTFASQRKEVLVIANTHQAVNNALNKIAQDSMGLSVVKIGEEARAEGLDERILNARTYNDYLKTRKNRSNKRTRTTDIVVGMTFHAAVVNVGLRNSGFQPHLVLVDEAGQMPFVYASLIGALGCGSIIFIGDDKQMPPIFHPNLVHHEFSCSIFEYLCRMNPELRHTLNITYRMNRAITEFVSTRYYERDDTNQKIIPSDSSAERCLCFAENKISTSDERIKTILTSKDSFFTLNVTPEEERDLYEDMNIREAEFAINLAVTAMKAGMDKRQLAIITPYRKQVKLISTMFRERGYSLDDSPLVNTVECLQGQDVEMIIISFSAAAGDFLNMQRLFLSDPHRLNVMISRAKTKVVILSYHSIISLG